MEIKIDDIIIDTEKSFDEQSQEVQSYLYNLMNSNSSKITFDGFNRPVKEVWKIENSDFNIVRNSVYINQNHNWNMQSQNIIFEEVSNE